MLSYDEMEYHPTTEKVVQIICDQIQADDPHFFRITTSYYFTLIASMMRTLIDTPHMGTIPVNGYAINLAPSGYGKGRSTNILERKVIHLFQQRFMEDTFPLMAEQNLPIIANRRAVRKGTDPDDELARVEKEFDGIGPLFFSFDSATTPAIKQLRHKLLLAKAGALNLQMDEIGSNLLANQEVLDAFLELYDQGLIKQKLTKNTTDNLRNEEVKGFTPTNMLLFGTHSNLLDGSKTEDEFFAMLAKGYARRCLFGYIKRASKKTGLTAIEVFNRATQGNSEQYLEQLSDHLERLADMINANKKLYMSKDTALTLIEYQLRCEAEAEKLTEFEEVRKTELVHRYFKALKLAGAYAFVDDSPELTTTHLYQAIKLVEDSGRTFTEMLTRDRPYAKLAKYLGTVGEDVTQADLVEDLPFYRGSQSQKQEMMNLAIAYGYKNNIVIKKSYQDGIEFLRGESLKETNLDEMVVSYTTAVDMTSDYQNETAPFDKLHLMTQTPGVHWVTHHLKGGYRKEDNAIPGFNLLVIDVDGTVALGTAKLLLKDYKALYYTTKSHTEQENRFRIILPTSHVLNFDAKDYKEFYSNVLDWLPFEADPSAAHRCKKWLSHQGHYEYTDGELLDVLPFIPKTSKNEERKQLLQDQQQLNNLERWVLNNTGDGNRNNMLLRYAMILVDAGYDFDSIRSRVLELNDKMPDKLEEVEILSTIMVSVSKAVAKR